MSILSAFVIIIAPPSLDPLVELGIGAALLVLTLINLRHLENIGNFSYVLKNPTSLEGKVGMRADYVHTQAANRELRNGILIFVTFIILNRLFFLGGAISALFLFLKDRILGNKRREEAQGNNRSEG